MEKRVVIFLIVSLIIVIGYDWLLKQLGYAPTQPPPDPPVATAPADSGPSAGPATSSRPTTAASQTDLAPVPPPPSTEEQVVVETSLFRAVFTTRGAALTNWSLVRFHTTVGSEETVQLVPPGASGPRPLALRVPDQAVTRQLQEGLYAVSRSFTRLDSAHPTGTLTFTYQSPDGALRLEKQLTFRHDTYVVEVAIRTEGLAGDLDIGLGTNFGITEWGQGFIGLIGPALRVDGNVEKEMPDAQLERKGIVQWVALQEKYFLSVFMPTNAIAAVVQNEGEQLASAWVRFGQSDSGGDRRLLMYAGPKEFERLQTFQMGLEDTIDFGWFIWDSWVLVRTVAQPLFYVLRSINDVTHNYGLAIVLLTVGIKLLFVPLQYKSYASMKKMQVIQPLVVDLQKKFKEDRERLNRELISLYRQHRVNPVGGCLPMLLQMPVFVALFNILYMTIELRHAPFMLWVQDLSAPDPYYLLPILMGVSMMIQQKIMPTTMDPAQARIMMLLPAFMTILFLNFASGLVLYWFTNNVLTIAQQVITDRYIYRKPVLPSAEEDRGGTPGSDGDRGGGRKKKKDRSQAAAQSDTPVDA